MTHKLQLMLINVLLNQFLNTTVSQGSVATRLRSDGIFNDQFIAESLLSPRVKKWKSVNICRSYGQLSTRFFFMKHGVYNIVKMYTPFNVLMQEIKNNNQLLHQLVEVSIN